MTTLTTLADAITAALLDRARNPCVTLRVHTDASGHQWLTVAVQHTVLANGGAHILTPDERFDCDGDLDAALPALCGCAVEWAVAAVRDRTGPRTDVTAPEPGRQWITESSLAPARAQVQWRGED